MKTIIATAIIFALAVTLTVIAIGGQIELASGVKYIIYGGGIALLTAAIDAELIKQHIKLSKAYHAIKFSTLLLIAILLLHPLNLLITMSSYWITFDISLNILRNKHPLYLNPKGNSFIDTQMLKILKSPINILVFKLFIAFLFLLLGEITNNEL